MKCTTCFTQKYAAHHITQSSAAFNLTITLKYTTIIVHPRLFIPILHST